MSFPRYPKYKDSGVEWLGEVPEHWELKRTRHVFSSIVDTKCATDGRIDGDGVLLLTDVRCTTARSLRHIDELMTATCVIRRDC